MKQADNQIEQVYIGYATETGNAYEIGLQTSLSLSNYVYSLCEINQDFVFKSHCLYILFVSTTGQGDPPYSMRNFWKGLMNKNYRALNNVKFCVYGLGDRSYGTNFNVTARKLRQRLLMLKAEEVISIGLGDEQDSNGCFDQYFKVFYPALENYIHQQIIKSTKTLQSNQSTPFVLTNGRMAGGKYQKVKLCSQKLLSSMEGKDLYWIEFFRPAGPGQQQIKIGDILQIFPENSEQTVAEMVSYFDQHNLNDLKLSQSELYTYLKTAANLENVLNFTFFTSNPAWLGLDAMLSQDLDPNIRQLFAGKLKQLGQDYDEYYNYIKKFRRNVREVISDFSLRIPVSCFIQRLGHIISRKYSIAKISDQTGEGCTIGLLISLERYKVSNNRVVKGLCSHDLCLSILQKEERSWRSAKILRNGQFSLELDFSKKINISMISLGTGVAPFLSILDQASKNKNNWDITLFHSSRYKNQIDKCILSILGEEKKFNLFLTCTRQKQMENRRLQFIIRENLPVIEKSSNGKIMICGAKQFCEIVCRIFEEELGLDVKKLKKDKVICIQNW